MIFHKEVKTSQGFFANDGIGIQYQDIFSFTDPECLVVGFGETYILSVFNECNFRKQRTQVFNRLICRMVIHYINICFESLRGSPY